MISPPVAESRLPVGSSASTTRGSTESARAIATRCCSPPEACARQVIGALGEPHLVEQLRARARAIAAGRDELHLDVLDRGQRRDQVELLEDEAERAQAQLGELVVGQADEVGALEPNVAAARPVERAEELQQRRLARAARAFERDELARLRSRGRSPSSARTVVGPRWKNFATPRSA